MVPRKRLVAVGALLLVGFALSQSFSVATGFQTTFVAEAADDETPPSLVAEYDSDIVNLDSRVESVPQLREPVETAVETGSFDGTIASEAHITLSDVNEDASFAVYDGRYYRFSLTVSDDPVGATIQLSPTDWQTVANATATPAEQTDGDLRTVLEKGTVTNNSFVRPGLYDREGTYLLVRPENEGSMLKQMFASFGGLFVDPLGTAYTVAGLGLAVAIRNRRTPRPLTRRAALAVVPGTVLFSWLSTLVFGSGSLAMRAVLLPGIAAVASFGLFAGLCLRRRAWKSLVAGSALLVGLVIVADVATLGILGAAFGALGLVAGWVGSLVLAVYGYVFAADADEFDRDRVGALSADDLQTG
ncbi:hypothetical protein C453_14526 [Haloferax elongans ATCC BAA-1513]|uniref:Uncharacterized protein n=1 Tax=Haloferax elongans ATCC BAA-1513 TaxID=1230453 RepID=M0HJF9_HALEO|nr:hypothetical protein [Haloferax elongans]ELZ83229.1 hypothetical protein C453_14526 [Haloferax elongans ATCC BAA-1513]